MFFAAVFFPYLGVVPGVDVQPNFMLFAFLLVILTLKNINLDVGLLFLFGLLCIMFFVSFNLDVVNLEGGYFLKKIFFLVAILLFILIGSHHQQFLLREKWLLIFFLAYVSVGTIQLFYPGFLAGVVTRSVDNVFLQVESGRGVRSLASEPAALGKQIVAINVIFVLINCIGGIRWKKIFIFCTFCLLANTLLSRSAYSIAIHFILVISLFSVYSMKFAALVSLLCCGIFSIIWFHIGMSGRIGWVVSSILNEPELLLTQGAFRRLVNIPISIISAFEFGYVGAGNSPDALVSTLPTPIGALNFVADNRALGGLIELFLSFGLLSVPVFICYFIFIFRLIFFKAFGYRLGIFFAFSSLLLTLQDGSISNPTFIYLNVVFYLTLFKNKVYFDKFT